MLKLLKGSSRCGTYALSGEQKRILCSLGTFHSEKNYYFGNSKTNQYLYYEIVAPISMNLAWKYFDS